MAYNPVRGEYLIGYLKTGVTAPDGGLPFYFTNRFSFTGGPPDSMGMLAVVEPDDHVTATFPFVVAVAGPIVHDPSTGGFLALAVNLPIESEPQAVYGRRLDEFGEPLGLEFEILPGELARGHLVSPSGNSPVSALRCVRNSLANEYLVTAQLLDGSGLAHAWAQRVSAAGELRGEAVRLTDTPAALASHALVYAPVVSAETPTGRYLVAIGGMDGSIELKILDSEGRPLPVVFDDNGDPVSQAVPFVWGTEPGEAYHPDLADGMLNGVAVFFVVWADHNNTVPASPPNNPNVPGTGIWAGNLSAEQLHYHWDDTTPDTSFQISDIAAHLDDTSGQFWWTPRVIYHPGAGSFFVGWRETPTTDPANGATVTHVRGARIEGTSTAAPPNVVLSRPIASALPVRPRLAAGFGDTALIVWTDGRMTGAGNGTGIYGQMWGRTPNDASADATLLNPPPRRFSTLAGASPDGWSSCNGSGTSDVWYRFWSPVAGLLRLDSCGTDDLVRTDAGIDTALCVHQMGAAGPGDEVACNDTWNSGSSPTACSMIDTGIRRDAALALAVQPEEDLLIRLSRTSSSLDGPFLLDMDFDPETDECLGAMTWAEGQVLGTTEWAGSDGATSCSASATPVAWYRFTASGAGTLRVATCGTNDGIAGEDLGVDTVISLHSGCPGDLSSEVACNDNWTASATDHHACAPDDTGSIGDAAVAAPLQAGQSVWVRVSRTPASPDGPFLLRGRLDACPDLVDGDGDLVGNGCDLCPTDGRSWSRASEVLGVRFSDPRTLEWEEPDDLGGAASALAYDVLRSSDPSDFSAAVCVEADDGTDRQADDAEVPEIGAVWFFLVRAETGCPAAVGTLGVNSDGIERSGRQCP